MKSFVRKFILYSMAGAIALMAQQDLTVQWKASLQDLERRLANVPADGGLAVAWTTDEEALRASLSSFSAANPDMKLQVPSALPDAPPHQAMTQQLTDLNTAVSHVIERTPGTPFNLGQVSVTVTAEVGEESPVTVGIDQTQIADMDLVNAAKALDYLPGVSIQHLSANRNEAGIMVRGFSTRGQVPLYIDGIPISVPYDGYVDFNRYLTSDISEVQVARGYSTPLLGPNALGGSINMVTEEPINKYNADALIGTGSGDTLLSSLRLGSRLQHFFFQGSIDWNQQSYIPLSGNFPVFQYKAVPDIVMTDHLNSSWPRDERLAGHPNSATSMCSVG
jgi:outer membrane receptor protein involved in Fe transport